MTVTFQTAKDASMSLSQYSLSLTNGAGWSAEEETHVCNKIETIKLFFSQEEPSGGELKEFEGLQELLNELDMNNEGYHYAATCNGRDWKVLQMMEYVQVIDARSSEEMIDFLRKEVAAAEEVSFEEVDAIIVSMTKPKMSSVQLQTLQHYFSQEKVRRDAKEKEE